jgi:hypothetical protein
MICCPTSRENIRWGNPVALKTFFPCFMAPAQELMEVHHTSSIGIAKTHEALKL